MRNQGLVALVVIVLLGCSAPLAVPLTETSMPSAADAPTPTPDVQGPTPTPEPTMTEEALAAVCAGLPVPSAAPYAGKTHPLVVIDEYRGDYVDSVYTVNQNWTSGKWTGDKIQLVVCVPFEQNGSAKVGSCGRWKRQSDGVTGKLVRYRYKMKVRVVVAATGQTLQSTTLYGSTPGCYNGKYSSLDLSTKPPWRMYGSRVKDAQVNKYATAVSKQKVK